MIDVNYFKAERAIEQVGERRCVKSRLARHG